MSKHDYSSIIPAVETSVPPIPANTTTPYLVDRGYIAEMMGRSIRSVIRDLSEAVRSGLVREYRIGQSVRYRYDEVVSWLDSKATTKGE